MRYFSDDSGINRPDLKNYYVRATTFKQSTIAKSQYTHLFLFKCRVPKDSDESEIREHYIYIGHNKRTISLKRALDTHNVFYPNHTCLSITYVHTLYRV